MKDSLTIFSWNVNGIRAVINKGAFDQFLHTYNPDILCLQEVKADKEQVSIDYPQYTEYWHSAQKKGYSGVAIFTKIPALSIQYGLIPSGTQQINVIDDQGRDAATEGRVITAEFEQFFLVNVYTPNAKDTLERISLRHKKWDPLFLAHCKELEKKKPIIFVGDLNVAHQEIDLSRPKENEGKKGFTQEEREGFDNFVSAGFVDTLRLKKGNTPELYTWWSPWGNARARNVGWRIDYVCASKQLEPHILEANIHPDVLGSDHCPVSIKLAIQKK
ncbi:MAG: exodeoxyribonuclease III [Candidatus Magasanikbacteria bacterium]|nr:exodeoxyribonuclease III [Candidatus Magasanikbacteria bacterium]